MKNLLLITLTALTACSKNDQSEPDKSLLNPISLQLYVDAGFEIPVRPIMNESRTVIYVDDSFIPKYIAAWTKGQRVDINTIKQLHIILEPGHVIQDGDHPPIVLDIMSAMLWNTKRGPFKEVYIYMLKTKL